MANINYEKSMASRVKVEIEGSIEDYAFAFLCIYNNVKSDPKLLKMYNDYDNGVYVVCECEICDAVKSWLSTFGVIKSVKDVEVIRPWADVDIYRDDVDTEFLDVEE